jgi:hypothetical protein
LLRKAAAGAASRQRAAVVFIVVVRYKFLGIKIMRSVRYKKVMNDVTKFDTLAGPSQVCPAKKGPHACRFEIATQLYHEKPWDSTHVINFGSLSRKEITLFLRMQRTDLHVLGGSLFANTYVIIHPSSSAVSLCFTKKA